MAGGEGLGWKEKAWGERGRRLGMQGGEGLGWDGEKAWDGTGRRLGMGVAVGECRDRSQWHSRTLKVGCRMMMTIIIITITMKFP